MGGLFGGSPPRDTILNQSSPEERPASYEMVNPLPPADTTYHQALRRFGLAPETEGKLSDFGDVHAPEDQFAQRQELPSERQDDNPLPPPPTTRPRRLPPPLSATRVARLETYLQHPNVQA